MKFVSPFVYALVLIPALAVTVALGGMLSGFVGTGFLWYVFLIVTGLVVGALVYAGIGRFLIPAEGSGSIGAGDHLRRCVFLYLVLVVTLAWAIISYLSTGGVGWPTFATEMQLHIISVVVAALFADRFVASRGVSSSIGREPR